MNDSGQDRLIRLKCDLHTHVIGDTPYEPKTQGMLSPREFVDLASDKGFDCLSFTYHDYLYYDADIWNYAKEKGVMLIPGTEISINGYHVLLLNCQHCMGISSFDGIRYYRSIFPGALIIAPHPFYKSSISLGKMLIENIDCFDAIEYCHFYTRFFNPNRKAVKIAKRFSLPLICCSDAHRASDFGTTYSYIYVEERSVDSIIQSIRDGRIEHVTSPLPFGLFFKEILWILGKLSYILFPRFKKD
ncbi:PHP domain-containing protein [bacterium]|nr:PHP domain-containing protein [bacterium]